MADPHTAIVPRLWVLDDPRPRSGPWNMALDEALLRNLSKLDATRNPKTPLAILRVYHWDHPSVSFGYFGSANRVRAGFPGQLPVRRWTGGGAVAHGEAVDWTYSLIVPREFPLCALSAAGSYAAIHGALARALEKSGLPGTSLAERSPDEALSGTIGAASDSCFTRPVRADVFRKGRKIAGAAQRRTREGLLHQGSVQAAELRLDSTGRAALVAAFVSELVAEPRAARWWRNPLEEDPIFHELLLTARTLAQTKYGSAAWLEKR